MRLTSFFLIGSLVAFGTGCGGAYQASSGVKFDVDGSGKEIDDTDVAKAFAAHPQLPNEMKVAYYTFDEERAGDIEKMLGSVKGVTSTYRIPKLLVTGERRFHESSPWSQPAELSTKKLRLLAARAHADVLVVFDHGWRGGGVNGLAALDILIIPIFVAPWISNETESYAQAFVIDVRNGYLYGEVAEEAKGGKGAVTIYADSPSDVAAQQWPGLLDRVRVQLAQKIDAGKAPMPAAAPSGEPAASGQ